MDTCQTTRYVVQCVRWSETVKITPYPQQVLHILEADGITRVYDGGDCPAGDVFCNDASRHLMIQGTLSDTSGYSSNDASATPDF
jgi:hypothetical protein